MAMHQHTPDLLLPSQFDPYDEEDLFAKNLKPSHLHKDFSSNSKPWEPDPHGHRNELVFSNSPVESDLGSADTESDRDDDYIAELTRQMSHYMLQEDHDQNSLPCTEKMEKTWGLIGSPQSTLWPPLGSSHGSPHIGPSQDNPFRDGSYDEGLRSSSFKPGVGLNSNPALTDDQLRAIQFYTLKQRAMKQQGSPNWPGRQAKAPTRQPEQLREQPQQVHEQKGGLCINIGRTLDGGKSRKTKPCTQSPTQTEPQVKCHQQKGSATRMFVQGGESSSESSCTGTGVFLPRGIWYSSEPRKKPGCSTVFIPARVVQALQLHFDQMGVTTRTKAGGYPLQHDGWMGRRNDSKQKRQQWTAPAMSHHDMGLPQEWKY
ncbi:hypothetical protein I3843_14G064700 [Carya illinoinensis]|uniref:Uncharacterized protein n=1 Tax=Carya illinoinensis TaxID=32201 RepID=A0A922D9J7_CARIL|nr:uncharacterized protein LOC122293293 isoform X2 [Carya illinoinensis]KAG2670057.1 hypothetical protein I3760_14G065800 [Carya illinoinensis]KAG6678164.1 hypothetical protein I3842_14G066200 [Carya illinoinensis]KAG7946874.1 hypothetical protein I3843_14G064700 [Carya illinoinensis]